jgi:hypothetical protein
MLDHSAKSLTRDPNGPVAREAQLPLGTHGERAPVRALGPHYFFFGEMAERLKAAVC